jgi:hypothetical protein
MTGKFGNGSKYFGSRRKFGKESLLPIFAGDWIMKKNLRIEVVTMGAKGLFIGSHCPQKIQQLLL